MRSRNFITLLAIFPLLVDAQIEEALPSSHPVTRYTAIWEDSPFTREVVKVVERKIVSSFANALNLEGLVNDDERGPVAYVRDITENKTIVITTEPDTGTDPHPYTIVAADLLKNPQETTVTITDGNETAEIGYAENALTRTIAQDRPPTQEDNIDPREAAINRNRPQPGQKRPVPSPGTVSANPPTKTAAQAELEAARKAAAAATPALDRLDDDTRQRRVPLPKK